MKLLQDRLRLEQSKLTWTCHKSKCMRELTGEMLAPRSGRTICASLRRHAHGHVTGTVLCENLQEKGPRSDSAPWSSTGLYPLSVDTLFGELESKDSNGFGVEQEPSNHRNLIIDPKLDLLGHVSGTTRILASISRWFIALFKPIKREIPRMHMPNCSFDSIASDPYHFVV